MADSDLVNTAIKSEIARVNATIDPPALEQVTAALNSLEAKQCSLCDMPGHVRSYCWLNAQMYAQLRNKPDAHVAWAYSKKHESMKAKQTRIKGVADAMADFEKAKLVAASSVLLARAKKE